MPIISVTLPLQRNVDKPRGGCYDKFRHAGMMELADMQDLGSCAQACGFKSHYPYHAVVNLVLFAAAFSFSLIPSAMVEIHILQTIGRCVTLLAF